MTKSPIDTSPRLSRTLGVDIRIKRDDLFPETGGGNKARKMRYIVKYAQRNGYTSLVTNGGVQSNHARAASLVSAKFGLHCYLVLHSENIEKSKQLTGNLLLMKQLGAEIVFCQLEGLSEVMQSSMKKACSEGYNPLYIWGGGHCLQGSLAYYDAAKEAQKQCGEWVPDFIIHASGTGTTQAGLIAGYAHLHTRIVGISVAREKERGAKVIKESLYELCEYTKQDASHMTVDFRDDWIFGGYEKVAPELIECIDNTAKNGLILDPTYTGKAYYGMLQMVSSGEIFPDSKVLFWHTGGLLNLLSSSCFLERTV